MAPIHALAVATYAVCVVLAGGRLKCWDGQTFRSLPRSVNRVTYATSCSSTHCCSVVKKTDNVACFGQNSAGECGVPFSKSMVSPSFPSAVVIADGASDVCTGTAYTCALTRNHRVFCWGQALFGVLGTRTSNSFTPVPISSLDHVTKLSCGDTHVCAVAANDTLVCWGFFSVDG